MRYGLYEVAGKQGTIRNQLNKRLKSLGIDKSVSDADMEGIFRDLMVQSFFYIPYTNKKHIVELKGIPKNLLSGRGFMNLKNGKVYIPEDIFKWKGQNLSASEHPLFEEVIWSNYKHKWLPAEKW